MSPSIAYIPRPKNPFIFFRSEFNKNPYKYTHSGGDYRNQNSVSRAAGEIWRTFTFAQKAPFVAMARRERERYDVEFPGYRYRMCGVKPRKRGRTRASCRVHPSLPPAMESTEPLALDLPMETSFSVSPTSTHLFSDSPSPVPLTPLPAPDLHPDFTMGVSLSIIEVDWDDVFDSMALDAASDDEKPLGTFEPLPSFNPTPLMFFNETELRVKLEEF